MALFERAEYERRIAATKRRMEDRGIEVLLAADPANMNYLTGYDGWSFYVHQLVVVALDAAEPIWIGRAQDASGAKFTTFLAADNILGYADDYVQSTVKHPMEYVADTLEQRGWQRRVIGVEMDTYYFTAAACDSLRASLPNPSFVDATALVNWVRAVKSPREIAFMREAARIVERAMQVALDAVAPGVRQCDAVAAIYHALVSGTADAGGDYPAIAPLLPTGVKSTAPHLTWSDDPYREDEGTVIEIAGCRHRYHCPMARTVYLGTPPPKLSDAARAVIDGLDAALAAAAPGKTCAEVEAAWRAETAKSGIVKESRIGYSVGLNYPPDWGEHTASLRPGDDTVLETDMTFHLIPAIWVDEWGVEISETIRLTETGAETLASFPRQLFVKP